RDSRDGFKPRLPFRACPRARIDMSHPNLNMRDPVLYRILKAHHHRTGDKWCIYPMYDWAHGQSDSIEGVTHSMCSAEFENHRPLYDWFLDTLGIHHTRQIEFGRMNVSHFLLSKRHLLKLVEGGHVSGWDDPRMPTLRGLRRRGYTPEAIRDFLGRAGLTKNDRCIEIQHLEHCLREDLNRRAPRHMGVLKPLKLVIDNYPENQIEEMEAVNNPEDPSAGTRKIPFSKVLYIEHDDFLENPPRKYFRMSPGREVRLRYGYLVTCTGVVKNAAGEVTEVHCDYDPLTRGGDTPDGRKVKGTLHWVSAEKALTAEVRLYDHLFKSEHPGGKGRDLMDDYNPDSIVILKDARLEPPLAKCKPGYIFQLERLGYFCIDSDSSAEGLVLNRTVTLKDSWSKIAEQEKGEGPSATQSSL
ncbi:MAG: glutamine--tRNA ligase, partial [Planctomycetes bacterium]|nr:glutamine--tRNA ligase [Planctomycetota bacterium]